MRGPARSFFVHFVPIGATCTHYCRYTHFAHGWGSSDPIGHRACLLLSGCCSPALSGTRSCNPNASDPEYAQAGKPLGDVVALDSHQLHRSTAAGRTSLVDHSPTKASLCN